MTFFVNTDFPDITVAMIPKNATQSIQMAMVPCKRITNAEALLLPIRIMPLREPRIRIASGYSFFTDQKAKFNKIDPPMPEWNSYEEFIDINLESSDLHFAPQYDQVLCDGVFVPNRIHWLKDIMTWWQDYFPGSIPDKEDFPHRHAVKHLATNDYRLDDIYIRFAKDYELCQRVS